MRHIEHGRMLVGFTNLSTEKHAPVRPACIFSRTILSMIDHDTPAGAQFGTIKLSFRYGHATVTSNGYSRLLSASPDLPHQETGCIFTLDWESKISCCTLDPHALVSYVMHFCRMSDSHAENDSQTLDCHLYSPTHRAIEPPVLVVWLYISLQPGGEVVHLPNGRCLHVFIYQTVAACMFSSTKWSLSACCQIGTGQMTGFLASQFVSNELFRAASRDKILSA